MHWWTRSAVAAALTSIAIFSAASPSVAGAQSQADFAAQAFNVLPPGQYGGLPLNAHSFDQLGLYSGLTARFDDVTDADLPRFFKPNVLGLGGLGVERTERPADRPGLKIERDTMGVPHVFADSRDDVMFGAGYVTAEDRSLLMDVLRGPGRLAALDVPGIDPFNVALSGGQFTPSEETESFLSTQVALLEAAGPQGVLILADIDNYIAGINAGRRDFGISGRPWNRNDVLGTAALLAAVFGRGGGDEARRAQFLSALQDQLGEARGLRVWEDLREENDPETSVSVDRRFKVRAPSPHNKGNGVLDADSLDTSGVRASAVSQRAFKTASNALLVGAERSASGHPLFVAGPQVGYSYPAVLVEMDLHGGGVDARGVSFPGSAPYVEIGRGVDFSWSATSASNDIIDQFVEQLCGDDTHYEFEGRCREMTTFHAGTLSLRGVTRELVFHETVHGPVIGYGTVDGSRVAVSQQRSTRGREVASAFGFEALNTNKVDSPQTFIDAASRIELTFNWFYADQANIAMFSSGRVPIRHPQVDLGLPTLGTGKYEWRGFLPKERHPQAINPRSGAIVNWNNKPAAEWPAADSNWSYGSVHRNELLEAAVARRETHSLGSLVGAMNRGATQDLRNEQVLPSIAAVLDGTAAPSPRAAQMLALLEAWRETGSSRLDRDQDGKIDSPGAAIMDAAWNRIADAVLGPVLGPRLNDLAALMGRDNAPSGQGSAYGSGWYGYVDKDLRAITRLPVEGPFRTRFCGQGDLAACRASLWAAIDLAGDQLASTQGSDPSAWRSDALREQLVFSPISFLRAPWTNRPTFQQAMSYAGHR